MTQTGNKKTRRTHLPAASVIVAILCGTFVAACSAPDCRCDLPMYEDGGEWG